MRPSSILVFATALIAAALGLAADSALAQDRPTEDELFGSPPPQSPPSEKTPPATEPAPAEQPPSRDDAILGAPGERARAPASPETRSIENPLALGGLLYLRSAVSWRDGEAARTFRLSLPNLLDTYLDARPNDRVRGYVLGRLAYDPTASQGAGLLAGDTELDPERPAASRDASQAEPQAFLDQLWVNFDIARTVFVTAGKQHVKWGVGRFWNPTDYLHPVRRDPLTLYDIRTGVNLVKAHLPWEARGWNFYGVALFEDVAGGRAAVSRAGDIGLGGRAELVFGTAELGADFVVQQGNRPRFGVDLSAGIWELDVYGEAALRRGTDVVRFREVDPAAEIVPLRYAPYESDDFAPQVTLGGSWSWKYNDEDVLTVGAEYFYNQPGYDDPHAYTALLAAQLFPEIYGVPAGRAYFNPFYLGKHYAGLFVLLPAPGRWNDTTFNLSAIGNVSDGTAIVRLDHFAIVNTYLRIETFVAGHVGKKGGEMRFAYSAQRFDLIDIDPAPGIQPLELPALKTPIVDFGVSLRVSL